MFNYKKRYYELLEEVVEINKENRVLRNMYNNLMKEKEELIKLLNEQNTTKCSNKSNS